MLRKIRLSMQKVIKSDATIVVICLNYVIAYEILLCSCMKHTLVCYSVLTPITEQYGTKTS